VNAVKEVSAVEEADPQQQQLKNQDKDLQSEGSWQPRVG